MSNNKYYSSYDRDISSIRGAGVILPKNPHNKNTSNTVKTTFNVDIDPIPPLYPITYDTNAQKNNGYLNLNNDVPYESEINKYYYPSQQLDKVEIINNKLPNILNNVDILKSDNKSINNNNSNEINNKEWHDGTYLYTFEPKILNSIYPWYSSKLLFPFENKNSSNYRDNINNSPSILPDIGNSSDDIENFTSNNIDYNIIYLIILSLLIIIYFIKFGK